MGIYSYEEAFGGWDKTSGAMRKAIRNWQKLYYGTPSDGFDPCQRIAYTVVSKIVRTVFGEYSATSRDAFTDNILKSLAPLSRQAVEAALIGGSCYLKPCPDGTGFSFTLIPRSNVLIFGRNSAGAVTDIGTVARSTYGRCYYTLLERRTLDGRGYLTITNRLFRAYNADTLGVQVPLNSLPDYEKLPVQYRFAVPVHSIGLVEVKTPMLNCVDGSPDGVSVFAPAAELIARIDENEKQLRDEFHRGQSRIIASRDLLKTDEQGNRLLDDHLFVGLDDDPEQVGITIFSPALRYTAYLERKQEYLRNVESVIGLKRGMLSDANAEDRTATEISSSAGDYNLTVMDFQQMWTVALEKLLSLCICLAKLYKIGNPPESPVFSVDWGNGILYDEGKTWEEYRQMVADGLMRPEIALGWRFNMPTDTQEQLQAIRKKYMPEQA